jgi:phosphinothricin acetyltransferase
MGELTIRPAAVGDLGAINDIYNHYVLCSTCTYQTEPETMEGRRAWFAGHGERHPVTVAVDGEGRVLGWGSLSAFHKRAAYARTVENSVYVHPEAQRRGVGRALLADLIERARAVGHHTIIAGIDAEQAPSVGLHEALGFERVALLREVGFKFERWLHVIYMQRMV